MTGGANGIGRCIAEAFLSRGAKAAVIDTDDVSGNKLKQRCGDKLLFVCGDVSDKQALERSAKCVTDTFGHVDYLINNACFSRRGLISGCGYEDFDAVLRAGVLAPYYLTSLLKEHFAPAAAVVNITSTRAFMSQPDTESYTAAKGGIAALTHAMAMSLSGKVRVNAVSPGGSIPALISTRKATCRSTPKRQSAAPGRACGQPGGYYEHRTIFVQRGSGLYHGPEYRRRRRHE